MCQVPVDTEVTITGNWGGGIFKLTTASIMRIGPFSLV